MSREKTFYEAFKKEMDEWTKCGIDPNITYKQELLISDKGAFFEKVGEENFEDLARGLRLLLSYYNTSRKKKYHTKFIFPITDDDKKKVSQSISTTKDFIRLLENQELAIPSSHKEFGNMDEMRIELAEKSRFLLEMMENRMMMFKKIPSPSKTQIINMIYKMCDEYKIPKSRDVRYFINNLDKD